MNNKAFYNLTYGVFFVGDKSGGKGERLHCEYRRAGRGEPCARGGFRAEYELHLRAY